MEITILNEIFIVLALSTFVNFLFTKIKVPTILGYLLTGIVAGPHLLALIKSPHDIEIMAEIGVILLMFTIGLEFSLNHLIKIRKIVFFGGFIQLLATAGLTSLVAKMYSLSWEASIFVGFLTALSSTALVLKILQERGELTSNFGRTVVGILIFQDIILIPLMLFTPLLGGDKMDVTSVVLTLFVKTLFIILLVYVGNKWVMPRLLHIIALTKNQELFLMSILLICISVALFTSFLGLSLAFGAFLGGLMISRSEYSQNAFSHLIPFKDTFTSFFFVSIGMLLDVNFVIENYVLIFFTVLIVIAIKTIVGGATAFLLGHTFKGTVIVGLAISQVGEFSFILAKIGQNYQVLTAYYYQLFLAVSIVTMAVSPFVIRLAKPLSNALLRLRIPNLLVKGLFPLPEIEVPDMQHHLVLIGTDSRSLNLSAMAKYVDIPYIAIVFDPSAVKKRQQNGELVVYGDALNEPILLKAHVDSADIVVVSIGDPIASMAIIEKIKIINKHAYIISRAKHVRDIEDLYKVGANQVIPEEFETAIDLFERILRKRLLPKGEIDAAISRIRNDNYGVIRMNDQSFANKSFKELPNVEIIALELNNYPLFIDHTLESIHLRKRFGVTLVGVKRDGIVTENPSGKFRFQQNDIAYILGTPEHIADLFEKANIVLDVEEQ